MTREQWKPKPGTTLALTEELALKAIASQKEADRVAGLARRKAVRAKAIRARERAKKAERAPA